MRESTSRWLQPMLDASEHLGAEVINELISQATMPAAEGGTPFTKWLSQQDLPAGSAKAIDWIRFGELLRERLGWDHYPEVPPEDNPGTTT